MVLLCALAFAFFHYRPSTTIRILAHANGDFTCEGVRFPGEEFPSTIEGEVSYRKRWFRNPRVQVTFETGCKIEQVPKTLAAIARSGVEEVQTGLPPELSEQLSHPELVSDPW